ncbi:DUF485 domain-containing protein [Streptomyces sp. NBC_01142]|uniref:DUF485 domain-containing protein n=1 Tax=Streptomyces sp. NBC_01142 TaxID=2975865 RepID=UPI00225AC74C|nr:DUF485 domain-containing protein [Streptomyces sp. NBC_01142]MCX4821381.1 DUF485 domain-containing protein [Streptomyces sp. NBC_01142]
MAFALVNGLTFGLLLLLACSAPDFMAGRVWGEINVGVLALLVQGSLLLWTAAWYDRRADHHTLYERESEQ